MGRINNKRLRTRATETNRLTRAQTTKTRKGPRVYATPQIARDAKLTERLDQLETQRDMLCEAIGAEGVRNTLTGMSKGDLARYRSAIILYQKNLIEYLETARKIETVSTRNFALANKQELENVIEEIRKQVKRMDQELEQTR